MLGTSPAYFLLFFVKKSNEATDIVKEQAVDHSRHLWEDSICADSCVKPCTSVYFNFLYVLTSGAQGSAPI